jgi:hypothetical protein
MPSIGFQVGFFAVMALIYLLSLRWVRARIRAQPSKPVVLSPGQKARVQQVLTICAVLYLVVVVVLMASVNPGLVGYVAILLGGGIVFGVAGVALAQLARRRA